MPCSLAGTVACALYSVTCAGRRRNDAGSDREGAFKALRRKAGCMSRLDRITTDASVCHGKPVIRGLRYPVQMLLELLASGMSVQEVLADYPDGARRSARGSGVCATYRGGPSSGAARRRMRFLVDAQLSVRLPARLRELGHDVLHTSSLPDGTGPPISRWRPWPTRTVGSWSPRTRISAAAIC